MPQRVISMFKAVHIQKEHRKFFFVARSKGDRLPEPVPQKQSIGKASQKIVLGRVRHLQRCPLCCVTSKCITIAPFGRSSTSGVTVSRNQHCCDSESQQYSIVKP